MASPTLSSSHLLPSPLLIRIERREDKTREEGGRSWDWQVTQIDNDSFSVVFPDPVMLRMATRSGKLFLSINNIMADIRDAVLDTPKAESMPEVWVKMWGVPPKQRRVDRLMAATTMIGRPIVVDELSLIRSGPVRMRFACRTPAKLRGAVQIWFNGAGYTIKLEPELAPSRPAAPVLPPPPPPNNGKGPDDHDKEKDQDVDKDLDASMGDDSIDTAAWDKLGISVPGPAAPASRQVVTVPVAASEGVELSIPNQYGSNLGSVTSPPTRAVADAQEGRAGGRSPRGLSPNPSQLLSARSPASGGRSNSLSGSVKQMKKTAVRKVSAEAVRLMEPLGAPATPHQTVMALAAPVGQPLVDPLLQEATKMAPISKAKRSKTVPAAPVRTSSRSKGAKGNMPSLQRSQLLQAQKNMEISVESVGEAQGC